MGRAKLLLTHPQIAVMAAAFAVGLAVTATGPAWLWALVPVGVAAQMLNEYAMHRFLFHLPPPRRQWAFDLLWRAHYGHHDFPAHPPLFFVPGFVALPMLAAHVAVAWLVGGWLLPGLGSRIAAALTLTGGVGTFLAYEWFHATAHLPVRRTAVEARVARLHGQHHFRDPGRWFHVSPGGEVFDRAFGTALRAEDAKRNARADFLRTLGMRPDDPRLVSVRARLGPRYGLTPDEIARAAR